MYKLLLVEDEQIIRDGLINRIDWASVGFSVAYSASDGESALQAIDDGLEFDAVLTDIRMERRDGLELLKAMRERGIHVPVVLFTGYDEFEYAQKAIEYGALHYLLKPSTNQEILNTFSHVSELLMQEHARGEVLQKATALGEFVRISQQYEYLLCSEKPYEVEVQRVSDLYRVKRAYCFLIQIGPLGASEGIGVGDFATLPRNYGALILSGCIRIKADRFCLILTAFDDDLSATALDAVGNQLTQAVRTMLTQKVKEEAHLFLTTAFDPTIDSPMQLRENYANALRLIDLRFFYEDGCHYAPEDMHRHINTRLPIDIPAETAVFLRETQDAVATLEDTTAIARCVARYLNALKAASHTTDELICILISTWFNWASCLSPSGIGDMMIKSGVDFSGELRSVMDYGHIADVADWLTSEMQAMVQWKNQQRRSDQNNDAIVRAIQYIREHLSSQLTLSEVAGTVYMSATYFSILFKRYTGNTFVRFVMNERVQVAKHLLAGGMRIYEVSERVGYVDYRYFSRIFQKITGMKLKEYRKVLTSDEP